MRDLSTCVLKLQLLEQPDSAPDDRPDSTPDDWHYPHRHDDYMVIEDRGAR